MSSKIYVNNLMSEMRNTLKKDPADPQNMIRVLGQRRAIAGNTLLIDPTVAVQVLNAATTHITWSLVDEDVYFTIDGSDPTLAGSARHIILQTNLGTIWGADMVNQVRLAPVAGAPVFIYNEISSV